MTAIAAVIRRIIELWTLAGGLLLLAIVLLNTVSLVGNIFANQPVRGDFEIVEMGVAVAVFAFLPYCQLTGANVTADIFTAWAGPRTISFLNVIASIIAFGFAVLLLWRMWYGLIDYRVYREVTTVYENSHLDRLRADPNLALPPDPRLSLNTHRCAARRACHLARVPPAQNGR